MKKLLGTVCLVVSSYAMASTQTNYMFFQSDSQAQLVKNADSSYTLTLQNPPNYLSYFSDRPVRSTGLVSLSEFLKLWTDNSIKDNFKEVPPNVAFAMMPASGKQQNFVAVVSSPHYKNNEVSYKLAIIDKQTIQTGKMTHVDAFFDNIPWNPGGFGHSKE
ncbi:hypothetical protein Lqui_0265 [Legionella quinlivanii]|uniref:Type IV secretion protein IcmL n=1 Tax=Legionella quinlivanii TaxID=45073 RepID=A0A0W0Y309_9GAMM|nr:hypothetical protein [Legionella quinlivanii]KTD51421.1 hypothetical protein Lqui_0265 [Legionella quinlivanii]MCW8451597.1 hypothetical protein [Legionella quinlivanii]SEG11234.1 hypothetical protein SAMN02746093_01910 [Legionella quinlivanii DSM 21216]STY10181.1 Uncharacterised protein [Legionella quinlivanii]